MSNEIYSLSVLLKLVDQLSGPMNKVGTAFDKMQQKYRTHGQGMRTFGRNMSMYVTLPLIGLGALATVTAVRFESAFTGVRKTVDATEEQFAELNARFKDLSTTIPQSYEDIARVGEAAGQLGIQTENILGFTKVMSDLGVTTNMSAEQASTQLARFANITQMSQKDFDRLGSTVVDLGNNLATTEGEIVEMGLRLASAGKQVGFTEAQTLGLAGALSSLGLQAQAGGTSFSRVMIEMSKATVKGGKELSIYAGVAGMSTGKFKELFKKDSLTAIQKFLSGVTNMGEKSTLVFDALHLGGIRVSDSLRRVAGSGTLLKDAMARGSRAWEENIALTREANLRYSTAASQFKMFWNEIRLFAAEMGALLIPVLKKMIEIIRPMIRYFIALPAPVKSATLVLAAVVAVLGPLILSIGILVGLMAALGPAATAVAAAMGPVLLIIVGITAAVVALKEAIQAISETKIGEWMGKHMGVSAASPMTTYGFMGRLLAPRQKPKGPSTEEQAGDLMLGGSVPTGVDALYKGKSETEITLRVVGDKATAIEGVDKKKGDAKLNVITQGYLGLAGAN